MGGGKKSKAPPAPDYAGLAQQEGTQNRILAQEMTTANRPTQIDQYGNKLSWTQGPGGQWTQNVSLTPQTQGMQQNYLTGTNLGQGLFNNAMVMYDRISKKDPMFGPQAYQAMPGMGQLQGVGGKGGGTNTDVNMNNFAAGPYYGGTNTSVSAGDFGASPISQGATSTGVSLPGMGSQQMTTGQGRTNVDLNQQGSQMLGQGLARTNVNTRDFGVQGIDPSVSGQVPQYDPNAGKSVADALYGSVMDRGRKEQLRETDTLTTQLRQQGLQPGTPAFDRAMQNLRTSQNDANLLAAQNATLAGGQEARDIYGAQLAGNQQRFGQMQGANATNLQNAQFQQQQQQQNLMNTMGINQQNLDRALAQQGMQQQNFQNTMDINRFNTDRAQLQQGMNQQGFNNLLARQQGNLGLAGFQQGQQQQNLNNIFARQQGNLASAGFQQGQQQQNFENLLGSAENARSNYLAQLQGQGQSYGQALANRNQNLDELSRLQSLAAPPPGTAFQGFGTATGYSPADMLGAANASYAARMGQHNSQNAKKGGLLGGGLSLAGGLLGGK